MAINHVACAARLQIHLSQTQVELGKPLTAIVTYTAPTPMLETLNLDGVRAHFYISSPPQPERVGGQQRWTLRLYPYDVGNVLIPAFHFDNAHTTPINIKILPAVDPKDGTPLEFNSTVSTQSPWLKQQVTILATLTSASAIQVLSTHEPSQSGMQIQPTAPFTIPIKSSTPVRYQHQLAWHFYSLRQGEVPLDQLFVYLQRDGVRTHQFVLRPITFKVSPLPTYLPATIPVGQLSLEATPLPWWQFIGSLGMVKLKLKAKNMLESDIPDLSRQFHSSAILDFYEAHVDTHTQTSVAAQHITREYQIPFTAHSMTLSRPAIIRLQYFDPELSRLVTTSIPLDRFLSLYSWIFYLVLILCSWFAYLLSQKLVRIIRREWFRYRGYQIALQQSQTADSVGALRQALQQVAIAEGWSANLSLTDWQLRWNLSHPRHTVSDQYIQLLNSAFYSPHSVDLTQIRTVLQPLLTWRLFS